MSDDAEKAPFEVRKVEGMVEMVLRGTLDAHTLPLLEKGVADAKRIVHDAYDQHKTPVRVLFDITDFSGTYHVQAMMLMKDLESHNRPFVEKTAIFGGSELAQVAAQVTVDLIGHPSLKVLKTREEAIRWLTTERVLL